MKRNGALRGWTVWLCLCALAPLGYLLQRLALANTSFAETYASAIYPVAAQGLSRLFGLLPFSFGEMTVMLAAVWIPAALFLIWRGTRRVCRGVWARLGLAFVRACAVAACCYFAFILLCGLNYERRPYAQRAGYDTSGAGAAELAALVDELAGEAAQLRSALPEDASGVFMPDSFDAVSARVAANYAAAAPSAPWLSGEYSAPKAVLHSGLLAHTRVTGMFWPFTAEANVSRVNSGFSFASTMAHESAHQRGFMREDEANFIAFYVCYCSPSAADRYSGIMLALIHCGNALYAADPELYFACAGRYSDAMRRDMDANNALWRQYEGPAAEAQEQINDAYLKANDQPSGTASYSEMVGLMVGWQRARTAG